MVKNSFVSQILKWLFSGIVILTICPEAIAQNEISATYSSGHIPTSYSIYSPSCNGPLTTLTVTLPEGESYQVTNIYISYTMTAMGDAYMSDQRSKIRCANTGIEESPVMGAGNSSGTYVYARDASIANQLYAGETTLTFEMWALRIWTFNQGCNTAENRVDNGTWTITLFYSDEIPLPNLGVNEPDPSATLDVGGKIRISDDFNVPQAGMIRWNEAQQEFEGYHGSNWKSFSTSAVLSDEDLDTRILPEANPDEDILRFETAGEERMTILDVGNVGIGNSEPSNKLSILGSGTSAEPVLKSESTFSGNVHVHAIEGLAMPAVGFGKGGYFTGGARGVQAFGEGGASPATIIGVEGTATGTAGIRVGLFGRAQGGATNWAGYFDDGNVYVKGRSGAGTLLPEARIHALENSTTAFPHFRLTETSANDYARIKFETQSDPGIFWDIAARSDTSASESRLNFYYSNPGFIGDKMTITGQGNVGIGTSNPANRLRVNGSTTSTTPVLAAVNTFSGNVHIRAMEGVSTPAIGYGVGGYFFGGQKGIESIGFGESSIGETFGVIGGSTGTAGTRIGLYGWATGGTTNWAGRFAQGDVWIENNLRTDANVMIGTTSTSNKLRVHGSSTSTAPVINVTTSYTLSADVVGIQTNCMPAIGYGIGGSFTGGRKGINSTASSSSSVAGCTAVDAVAIGTAGTKIGVRGDASGAGINWAGYFAQGNVYVNNELRIGSGAIDGASGYKMAVDGKIIAEEVRVQLSGAWPDYVFETGYELMELNLLKAFILEKKHLPGIPPAEEMNNDGLALGEIQIKQMEKIEELTLYIIALQEQMNKIEAKLLTCSQTDNPK